MEFDHIVHWVQDLDEAMEQYKSLGFVMRLGGKFPDGVQNIVTRVQRGYIESIAVVNWDTFRSENPPEDSEKLYQFMAAGGGASSFGISADNLDSILNRLQDAGIRASLSEGSIQQADGTKRTWRYLMVDGGPTEWYPFFIDYGTPWENRADRYGPQDAQHWTISRIVIETATPLEHGRWLATVFDSVATPTENGVCVALKNGDVELTKGTAERITRVLFKEPNAPVGEIQRLRFEIDS